MTRHAKRLEKPARPVPNNVLARLSRLPLPGNVRELEHEVVYALVNGSWRDGSLDEEPFADAKRRVTFGTELPTPEELVDQLIEEADRRFPDDRAKAAAALGLSRQAMANRRRRSAGRPGKIGSGLNGA